MIVISMLLVVVGAVTLVLGIFGVGDDPLQWVYVSIGACLLAAVFLLVGVVRGRPSRRPVTAAGGQEASWSGASAWRDADAAAGPAVLERDQPDAPSGSGPAPGVEVVSAEDTPVEDRPLPGEEAFAPPPTDPTPAAEEADGAGGEEELGRS